MSFLPIAFISFIIYSSCIGGTKDITEAKFVRGSAIFNYIYPHIKGEQTLKITGVSQNLFQVTRSNSNSQVQE